MKYMSPIKSVLRNRIQLYLNLNGWSRADLVAKLGVGNGYISKLMAGHLWPSYRMLKKIADAFGVDITDLLCTERTLTPSGAADLHAQIGAILESFVKTSWRHNLEHLAAQIEGDDKCS